METIYWVLIIIAAFIMFLGHSTVMVALTWFFVRPPGFVRLHNVVNNEKYWVQPGIDRLGITHGHIIVKRSWLSLLTKDLDLPGGVHWLRDSKGRVVAGFYPRDAYLLLVNGIVQVEFGEVQRLDAEKREHMARADEAKALNRESQRDEVDYAIKNAERVTPVLMQKKSRPQGGGQSGNYNR